MMKRASHAIILKWNISDKGYKSVEKKTAFFLIIKVFKNQSQMGFILNYVATSKMQHDLVVFYFLLSTMSLKIIRLF